MTFAKKLNVTKLHINSEVQCRFATTEINSRVENVSEKAEEAEFVANLPEGAFITYFEMEIDGKVIVGDVKEKQQAKADYDAAKSRGETAGHVAQAPRETNTFNISVNIAPYNFARFKLVYQELLQRVRGAYKHQINVHPGQAVDDLQVNVTINESSPISIIHVPTFAAKLSDKSNKELLLLREASDVRIEKVSDTEMTVKWHPCAANQTQYLTNDVLDGQLIVLYDVNRNDDQVLVVDGHFIHFLAPKNLDIGSKNIVFALDISGSMGDGKLEQTKTAMRSILNQLRAIDQFSILCFDTQLEVWKKRPLPATKENICEAIGFIDAQRPRGGTDIDLAVQEGIKWLKGSHSEHLLASILVLLTDGQHNSGRCGSHQITSRILQARWDGGQHIKVYGLGFGNDADFNLLREMSTKTGGFARKIYAASDAAIQLDSFYAEISSPLLADLDIKYVNPNVEVVSTVKNITGDTLFEGSEFVLIGKMSQLSLNEGDEILEWRARSCHGPKVFKCCYRPWHPQPSSNKGDISKTAGDFIERSWAYLTVKNLLEKAKVDSMESAALKSQALKLALKYKFVTEQTSMVVTQTEKAIELEATDQSASTNLYLRMPMPSCGNPSILACSTHPWQQQQIQQSQSLSFGQMQPQMCAMPVRDVSQFNRKSCRERARPRSRSPVSDAKYSVPGLFGGLSTSGSFGAPSTSGLFGAPSASGSFGAPSASGLFGSPSAPGLFGASSTSGSFGASSAPGVFGGLPTSGSFGASSASGLFGAPSASVSFGASSAPGVFGAPSASVSFGASSAPGLFGASSTSGVFGAPSASVSFGASSAPGLFGASHGRGNGTAIKEKCFVPLSCKSGGSADKVLKEVTVSEKKRSWNEEGDMLGWSTVCNNVNEGGSIAETDNDGCTVEIDKVLAELPKRQRDKKAKAHVQLNALVGRGEEQLHEMCDDQPPTVIEKLINPPINSAIAVFIKLSDIQQKISTDNNAKESRLLSFIAAMVASTLPNSPSEKDLLKSLLEKSSEEIRIREVNESQYVVECDAGQLVTVPSILLAIHWKIRLNKLCGIETQNLLIQFLSVVVGTTRNGAMESLAKQVIAALDA